MSILGMRQWSMDGSYQFVLEPVAFVAASSTVYVTATSQNQTIPASVATGDLLIAAVMHRAALTPAAGWTLVSTVSCTENGTTTQSTSVYKRVAQSGDAGASTTWTQATSQRMSVHIMAFRRSGGCDVVDNDTAFQSNLVANTNVGNMAVSVATADLQMGVAVASAVSANNVAGDSMAASVGTLTTPATATGNRLGVAYRSRNSGETTAGTFTTNLAPTTTANGWAAVSLVIG
ncbi:MULTISPECIES: hypothetical protein [Mesorhizobium]|uniref:hypothetical protein n=1 Tax=Mesorhizobium TaxID=68287 RepID=UPI0007A95508|nr:MULTISPECIES: hypothetical protein [Mesorhizobium]AMX93623.1 hypothetical protein A4R28_11200 [Mesorhizobium ciceri]MDF3208313.1 hypothetical protein [Mesorhizobium sp. LMG15046]MDF3229115.1 hypothetical protein [Mesorhizobium sp. DSM 30133]RUU22223.1 hypothetical protein EOC84_03690 [Mesorhizobium sp. Primo-B]RUU37868.1 hypothetical protein EOC83_16525 [Mesorhizobium sp. Primo-A]